MSELPTDAIVDCIAYWAVGESDHSTKANEQLQALVDENKRLKIENSMLALESVPIPKLLREIAEKDARIAELEAKQGDKQNFTKMTYPDGTPMYDPDSAVWEETE